MTDRDRFDDVVAATAQPVLRYLLRRTDDETAADVLSEVLLVLWRRLDQVPADPLPWAYGVARNCLTNAQRGQRRQLRLVAKLALLTPRVPAEAPADDPELEAALAALPVADAELLRLWAWEELAPREIAEVLGITAGAVSVRLTRAKGRLRDLLGKAPARPGHIGVEGSSR